jgi:hypothetical protein
MRVKSGVHPTAFAQFYYEHYPLVSILKCGFFTQKGKFLFTAIASLLSTGTGF